MTTTVREKPILMCGWKVRRIMEWDFDAQGDMQTRRPVKPQPDFGGGGGSKGPEWNDQQHWGYEDEYGDWIPLMDSCPYQAGMLLWVRESFRFTEDIDGREVLEFKAGGTRLVAHTDDGLLAVHGEHRCTSILPRWRPSPNMPRWASRLTLEITSVRVERVQDISEADAQAEGVSIVGPDGDHWENYRDAFAAAWNQINGVGAWESSPWVWCIAFRRLA